MDEGAGYGEFLLHPLGKGSCCYVSFFPQPQHLEKIFYSLFPFLYVKPVESTVKIEIVIGTQFLIKPDIFSQQTDHPSYLLLIGAVSNFVISYPRSAAGL